MERKGKRRLPQEIRDRLVKSKRAVLKARRLVRESRKRMAIFHGHAIRQK